MEYKQDMDAALEMLDAAYKQREKDAATIASLHAELEAARVLHGETVTLLRSECVAAYTKIDNLQAHLAEIRKAQEVAQMDDRGRALREATERLREALPQGEGESDAEA